MVFGNVVVGEVHPQPHISMFGNRKKVIFINGTHQFSLLHHRFGEAAFLGEKVTSTVEHGSTVDCSLSEQFFFFLCVLFNNIKFFFFFKKLV